MFNFIFCEVGCIYQQHVGDMSEPTYANFTGNSYRNVFGREAAVMLTEVAPQSTDHIKGLNGTYAV